MRWLLMPFLRYADVKGRSGRAEFWTFFGFQRCSIFSDRDRNRVIDRQRELRAIARQQCNRITLRGDWVCGVVARVNCTLVCSPSAKVP